MKNQHRKQVYDELSTLIGRQTVRERLSPEESRFLLDYVDNVFFERWSQPLAEVLESWLQLRGSNEECDALIYYRLLETEMKDESAVRETKAFIQDLVNYYRNVADE